MVTTQTVTADESGDILGDKDDTEIELERIIFGDEAGFHERVRYHGAASYERDVLDINRPGSSKVVEENDLEGVDDSDVRTVSENGLSLHVTLMFLLAVLPRLWPFCG